MDLSRKTHELKIWPEYFHAVLNGTKTFELRKADRAYCFGDNIILEEWIPDKSVEVIGSQIVYGESFGYTGRKILKRIGYILRLHEDRDGVEYVILSLLDIPEGE